MRKIIFILARTKGFRPGLISSSHNFLARHKGLIVLAVLVLLVFWGLGGTNLRLAEVTQAVAKTLNSLKGGKIVIDPGHGGVDGGTNSQDFLEKDINLKVAKKLQSLLVKRGAKVILTREQDISPGNPDLAGSGYSYRRALNTRVVIIEKNKPDVFLSIHVNANRRRPASSGSIVYYNKAVRDAGLLSEALQKHLNLATNKHGFKGHLPRATNFYILRNTTRVGAIVEIGFMTNPREKELLKQEQYQWELARAIVDGLNEYMVKRVP